MKESMSVSDKKNIPDSFLFSENSIFVEELYNRYLSDPSLVDSSWQQYFRDVQVSINHHAQYQGVKSISKVIGSDVANIQSDDNKVSKIVNTDLSDVLALNAKSMINAYRNRGHYLANLDPLELTVIPNIKDVQLDIKEFGFTEEHLSRQITLDENFSGQNRYLLQALINKLQQLYCGNIASEFDHVSNLIERQWLYEQFENQVFTLSNDRKKKVLQDLVEIEGFEQYIHVKFPGAKRFSVEGGDNAIIALNSIIENSVLVGVSDVVLGMAHRGRLNTITKVIGKPCRGVFSEFMGAAAFPVDLDIPGDVKYHMGYSSDKVIDTSIYHTSSNVDPDSVNHKVHLSLLPNPSHLEAINPVLMGKVRAKQDVLKDTNRNKVLGILVHGDAAFCGQGVVYENFMISGLTAYDVGGIIHVVINNQVGFTAKSKEARPNLYATNIAKVVDAPILHINGDDVEAVIRATNIAVNYRQKFGKDFVIDIVCYRKYGHNEGDEPMYTQGPMYKIIKTKQTPGFLYAKFLQDTNVIDSNYFNILKSTFKKKLDKEYELAKCYTPVAQYLEGLWKSKFISSDQVVNTGLSKSKLQKLGISLCNIPEHFALNPKLKKLFDQRLTLFNQDAPIDWATAEQLAFASLLIEGVPVRITGQDSERGTFSHRHSVLHSQVDNSKYVPLNHLSNDQAYYEVANSNLSEYAVLGFEYGYSWVNPMHLVIWEAQFGDFSNGGQIIFDQFISSAKSKWLRMSGLVVLLPHGAEGQGPEHSSARLERFLQLAADDNMYITYPTTPASFFHLLRRQIYDKTSRPLIVMSPKSLLRHKLAVSALSELDINTKFLHILDDLSVKSSQVTKVIFSTGKVHYDLLEMRDAHIIKDVALIRLEQLYPFPKTVFAQLLQQYKNAKDFIWCQEEHKNMGGWHFIRDYLNDGLQALNINNNFKYVGRASSSSPAVGYLDLYKKQQEEVLKLALGIK